MSPALSHKRSANEQMNIAPHPIESLAILMACLLQLPSAFLLLSGRNVPWSTPTTTASVSLNSAAASH